MCKYRLKLKNNPKFQRHIQCLQFLILFSSRMGWILRWRSLIPRCRSRSKITKVVISFLFYASKH
nr:hypothetical protein Iba_chr06aCG9490 [Ipomoea batatas]GMD46263.1 hypothetical protein Iba_chr10eCG1640 [Ipomoea batatas]